MFEIHTTSKNEKMMIAEMGNIHLLNTIRLHLRKAVEIRKASMQDVRASAYQRRLYQRIELDEDEAAELIRSLVSGIYPYMAEAFYRTAEINDSIEQSQVRAEIFEMLNFVLERNGTSMISGAPVLQLPMKTGNSSKYKGQGPSYSERGAIEIDFGPAVDLDGNDWLE